MPTNIGRVQNSPPPPKSRVQEVRHTPPKQETKVRQSRDVERIKQEKKELYSKKIKDKLTPSKIEKAVK